MAVRRQGPKSGAVSRSPLQRARTASPPPDKEVGARIRAARKAAGVGLQILSDRTGLSIGYLSQVERGMSSASVRALAQIAEGLGIGLSGLFARDVEAAPAEAFAFGPEDRTTFDLRLEGIEKVLLTPGAGGLRLFLMTIQRGGHSGEAYFHAGEEAGHILQGRLELTVDERTEILETGASFRFASERPHRWRNAGRGVCRVLWVNATGAA